MKDEVYQDAWKRFYVAKPRPGEGTGWLRGTNLVLMTSAGRLLSGTVKDRKGLAEGLQEVLEAYAKQHQEPVPFDLAAIRELGVTPFFGDIIAEGNYVRHDAGALAETIFRLYDRYGRTLERMRRTE